MSESNEKKPTDDRKMSPFAKALIKTTEKHLGVRVEIQDEHQAFLGADVGPFIKEMELQNA